MHFGFAVYEVFELEQTVNSLVRSVLPRPTFANQGAQNLRDVDARSPCHANPTVPFAQFGGAEALFFFLSPAQITTLPIIWP